MRYYLARYEGSGTDDDPFRPSGSDLVEGWSAIDLRPDSTVTNGFGLLASPVALPISSQRIALTDDPDDQSPAMRGLIASRLGLTVDNLPFRRLVMHLLRDHGDDANPSRWNRLRPAHRILPDGRRARALEVWLGGLLHEELIAADGPGATFTDDFNRANSTTLGGSWTETVSDLQIVSNLLGVVSSGVDCRARWDADLDSSDTYCQVVGVSYIAAGSQVKRVCPTVRHSSLADTFYGFRRQFIASLTDTTARLDLLHVVAGVVTGIGNDTDPDAVSGEILKVSANGSTIKGYLDGVEKLSATDVTIVTGTRAGIWLASGSAIDRCRANNWECGDLAVAEGQPTMRRWGHVPHMRVGRGGQH